eukprot:CAMPEP_0196695784 /NCGR_PEP_ID=MMETSP1090-20130531/37670_1 /TAXON_ID=37098 /ORGANISM="Isochrysis sp, Strain CCMP1244" /LENGTH=31 /DNA_ID= /DNA_START= /DNA_END= /DNA_ORIENTATION=
MPATQNALRSPNTQTIHKDMRTKRQSAPQVM